MKKILRDSLIIYVCLLGACGFTNPEHSPVLEDPIDKATSDGFENITTQVFSPFCFECHSQAGGNKGLVNLENYDNVVGVLESIRTQIEFGDMPPSEAPPLPAEPKARLLLWISRGAPF
ncbi:MAG: hypothetical protein SGJ18_02565 [Pseudomonadota bacterium]|nr:hypothetical protein [Pseudomonadota bacterium]